MRGRIQPTALPDPGTLVQPPWLPCPSPARPLCLQGAVPLQQPNAHSQAGCSLFPFLPVPQPQAEHPRSSPCVAPPGSCPGCCREALQSGAPPGLPQDPPFPHALGPQRAAPRRPLRALSPSLPNVELAGSKADQWEMSSSSPARSRGVITAAKTSTGHAPLAPRSSWGAPGPPRGEQLCYAVLLG